MSYKGALLEALIKKLEGDIAVAEANINVYVKRSFKASISNSE